MHTVRLHHSSRLFQVGKIVCVARNYGEHVRELHNRPANEPVFFLKPASSIIRSGETAVIPPYSQNCHHEVELAETFARKKPCSISPAMGWPST